MPASRQVTVRLPAVRSVTLSVCVPATNAVFPGRVAPASLDVIATVSLVLMRFQLASTALTMTSKAVPATWPEGVPVLPVAVACEKKIILNSWDRFELILPGSRVALCFGEPLVVPPDAKGRGLEECRLELETRL